MACRSRKKNAELIFQKTKRERKKNERCEENAVAEMARCWANNNHCGLFAEHAKLFSIHKSNGNS